MPDLQTFETGFGLFKGKTYGGYKLHDIEGDHEAVIKYKQYKYYLCLIYIADKSEKSILTPEQLYEGHVFEDKTLTTHYGNPYLCHLYKVNMKSDVEYIDGYDQEVIRIYLEGDSHRI